MLHECPSCRGARTISITVPEKKAGVSHPNGWTGKPERVEYLTGKMVERRYQCDSCDGTGVISDLALARLFANVSTDQLAISDRAAQS
jgi:hypothetical protein